MYMKEDFSQLYADSKQSFSYFQQITCEKPSFNVGTSTQLKLSFMKKKGIFDPLKMFQYSRNLEHQLGSVHRNAFVEAFLFTEISTPTDNAASVWTLSAQDMNDDDIVCILNTICSTYVITDLQ